MDCWKLKEIGKKECREGERNGIVRAGRENM
jgi:hypothetical protein